MINPQAKAAKEPSPRKRLAFADGLRGFAALWVVFFHLSEGGHIKNIEAALPNALFTIIFNHGDLGVAIFFVLSGFVMALTVRRVHVDAVAAIKFLSRRFLRLIPPYYFAIVFAIALIFVKSKALGEGGAMPSGPDVFAHLFFLQGFLSKPDINTVFWTLCIEVQFYIAFAIAFILADYLAQKAKLAQARYMLVVVMAIIALLWPMKLVSTPLWSGGFIMYWYSFLAGVLSYWACHDSGRIRLYAYVYGLLVIVIGFVTEGSFPLMVGFTSLLLIYAGTRDKMGSWLSWKWIQFLGLISYSLYLLHNPITGAAAWLVKHWLKPGLLTDGVTFLATISISIFVSWVVFLLIERLSINWSHTISMKKHQVERI